MVEKAIHGSSRNRLISSCRPPSLYIHPGSPPSIPRPLVILFPPSPSSSISCMFSHPAHSSHPFTIGLDKLNHHTADHVHMFYSLSLLRTFLISSILFTVYRLCCLLISHILSTVIPPIPSQSDTLPHFSAVHISLSSSCDVFRIHPKSRALSFARLTTLVPCSVLWALQFIALALSSRSLMLILDNVSFCVNRFLVFYLLSLPAVFVCRVPHKCNLTRFECPFLSHNIRGI